MQNRFEELLIKHVWEGLEDSDMIEFLGFLNQADNRKRYEEVVGADDLVATIPQDSIEPANILRALPKRGTIRFIPYAAAAALLVSFGIAFYVSQFSDPERAEHSERVTRAQGSCTSAGQTLTIAQQIPNTPIFAGTESICDLQLNGWGDSVVLRMQPGSNLTISISESKYRIEWITGKFLMKAQRFDGEPHGVIVRSGEAEIRPTGTSISFEKDANGFNVGVYEGRAELKDSHGVALIPSGMKYSDDSINRSQSPIDESGLEALKVQFQDLKFTTLTTLQYAAAQREEEVKKTEVAQIPGTETVQVQREAQVTQPPAQESGVGQPAKLAERKVRLKNGELLEGMSYQQGDQLIIVTKNGQRSIPWNDIRQFEGPPIQTPRAAR